MTKATYHFGTDNLLISLEGHLMFSNDEYFELLNQQITLLSHSGVLLHYMTDPNNRVVSASFNNFLKGNNRQDYADKLGTGISLGDVKELILAAPEGCDTVWVNYQPVAEGIVSPEVWFCRNGVPMNA